MIIAKLCKNLGYAEAEFKDKNTYGDLTYVVEVMQNIIKWDYETKGLDQESRWKLIPPENLKGLENKCKSFLSTP